MIIAFGAPHEIGSICRFPCSQCKDDPERPEEAQVALENDTPIGTQPLYIKREATLAEYLRWCQENLDDGEKPACFAGDHYYEVTTD